MLLGTISKGKKVAEERLAQLKKAFPEHKFDLVPHESRFQIEWNQEGGKQLPLGKIEQMKRITTGSEPIVAKERLNKKITPPADPNMTKAVPKTEPPKTEPPKTEAAPQPPKA